MKSHGTIYYNYDVNDKILCSLPPKWRAQDTTLRASKDSKEMSLAELVGILLIHEHILQCLEKNVRNYRPLQIRVSWLIEQGQRQEDQEHRGYMGGYDKFTKLYK